MNADRRQIAWDLVREYMAQHMSEIPVSKRAKFQSINTAEIAPLGALVDFELARLGLSYTQAAIQIGRNLPEHLSLTTSLAPSTLFYFKKKERATWRARPESLEQLAYGFGWDIAWLRRVNAEPANEPSAVGDLPEPIAGVVRIMSELDTEHQEAIHSFAASLLQSRGADQSRALPTLVN